jgi:hypothetical protein
MITANEIIGCLVYRTCRALNGNRAFLERLKEYRFYPAVAGADGLHLWHYPGTAQEISEAFRWLSEYPATGARLKFPAVLNFQGVIAEHEFQPGITRMHFNLAIVTPVEPEWKTQLREEQAYRLVLRPIEDELIRQIDRFRFFQTPAGRFPYMSVYVPTTGKALNSVMKIRYGDFIDALELPGLTVKVMDACDGMSREIAEENKKVTEEIKNLTQ